MRGDIRGGFWMRQVGIRPGGVEDGCWEVGKNLYSRPVGFNLVVAGNGIYFFEGLSSTVRQLPSLR